MRDNFVKSIEFNGFKLFENFSVSCREHNILVGPNNSGKSSILDALRVTSGVLRYAYRRTSTAKSQGSDGVCATHIISPKLASIDLRNCSYNYSDEQAKITIRLNSRATFTVLMESNLQIEAYLITSKGGLPRTTKAYKSACRFDPVIVPTLSPLEAGEPYVRDGTVERNKFTRLASSKFKNI